MNTKLFGHFCQKTFTDYAQERTEQIDQSRILPGGNNCGTECVVSLPNNLDQGEYNLIAYLTRRGSTEVLDTDAYPVTVGNPSSSSKQITSIVVGEQEINPADLGKTVNFNLTATSPNVNGIVKYSDGSTRYFTVKFESTGTNPRCPDNHTYCDEASQRKIHKHGGVMSGGQCVYAFDDVGVCDGSTPTSSVPSTTSGTVCMGGVTCQGNVDGVPGQEVCSPNGFRYLCDGIQRGWRRIGECSCNTTPNASPVPPPSPVIIGDPIITIPGAVNPVSSPQLTRTITASTASCSSDRRLYFDWLDTVDTLRYAIRINMDPPTDPGANFTPGSNGDILNDNTGYLYDYCHECGGRSDYTVNGQSGHLYSWWVHPIYNDGRWGPAHQGERVRCP